jgi:hypothetical protein
MFVGVNMSLATSPTQETGMKILAIDLGKSKSVACVYSVGGSGGFCRVRAGQPAQSVSQPAQQPEHEIEDREREKNFEKQATQIFHTGSTSTSRARDHTASGDRKAIRFAGRVSSHPTPSNQRVERSSIIISAIVSKRPVPVCLSRQA